MTPEEFAARRRRISDHTGALLRQTFTGLGSWRDEDAQRFVAQAVPLVQGGQRALAGFVAAYVASRAAGATGLPVAPPPVPDTAAINLRRGVTPAEVYRRPFATLYTALSRSRPLTTAVELGAVRLERITEADLQLTYAHASRAALRGLPAGVRPTQWRRVLIGSENCALCVVASTNRYSIEHLNPIHPGCDCGVEGVLPGDPHRQLDDALLERVHAAAEELTGRADRGARAPDYRHLIVSMTAEHGELGPMLVRPRDRFTGPKDL